MTDRIFAISGRWALASDGIQWILLRGQRKDGTWPWPVSFVASTRDVLARCMREKGCPPIDAAALLAALPAIFDQWQNMAQSELEHGVQAESTQPDPLDLNPPKTRQAKRSQSAAQSQSS